MMSNKQHIVYSTTNSVTERTLDYELTKALHNLPLLVIWVVSVLSIWKENDFCYDGISLYWINYDVMFRGQNPFLWLPPISLCNEAVCQAAACW